jgi:ABC-type uncharacterized transport system permease subunit
MAAAIYSIFGVGIVQLWLAAIAAIAYLRGPSNDRILRISVWVATGALLSLAAAFTLRFAQYQVVPLASGADSILLFCIMATATAISVSCQVRFRALLGFYLPPLALLSGVCAALAVKDFSRAPSSIEVSQALLVIHVGLAFQAYALFFIASLTSVAYLFQARRLKLRKTTGLFQKLPSLENLDRTLHLLIMVGYPIFVVTLLMGIFWARFVSDTLSDTWWYSPKIVLSFVMVCFYAASFHSRSLGLLRGPKLAYFVFIGFGLLLGVYLLLEMLRLTNYNFWGAGA